MTRVSSVLPDVELLVLNYLRARPELVSVTVASVRPADMPAALLVARRVGGVPSSLWRKPFALDHAAIACQAWHQTQAKAFGLASVALAALGEAKGSHPEGTVSRIRVLSGLVETPDSAAPQEVSSYVFTVALDVRPPAA